MASCGMKRNTSFLLLYMFIALGKIKKRRNLAIASEIINFLYTIKNNNLSYSYLHARNLNAQLRHVRDGDGLPSLAALARPAKLVLVHHLHKHTQEDLTSFSAPLDSLTRQ